jgi:hypothetical protein
VVADLGYYNFNLLNHWGCNDLFRGRGLPEHSVQNVLIDEIIELTGVNTQKSTQSD